MLAYRSTASIWGKFQCVCPCFCLSVCLSRLYEETVSSVLIKYMGLSTSSCARRSMSRGHAVIRIASLIFISQQFAEGFFIGISSISAPRQSLVIKNSRQSCRNARLPKMSSSTSTEQLTVDEWVLCLAKWSIVHTPISLQELLLIFWTPLSYSGSFPNQNFVNAVVCQHALFLGGLQLRWLQYFCGNIGFADGSRSRALLLWVRPTWEAQAGPRITSEHQHIPIYFCKTEHRINQPIDDYFASLPVLCCWMWLDSRVSSMEFLYQDQIIGCDDAPNC